ncbi:MAG: hypothetical protein HQK54_13605, partial [Oligoflexales bacterium]|nr:hypothetical protein [Oligoflexales bacterium]
FSGLSTTDIASETSGRGIGLQAVKTLLDKFRGNIEIVLLDENSGKWPFLITIFLPKNAAVLEDCTGMAA